MDTKLLGARIKYAREMRELSIDQLANFVNVNKSTISRYERGEIARPKIPVVGAIADVLCVNPSWLVGKSEDITYTPRNIDFSSFKPCNLFIGLRNLRESFGYSANHVAFRIGISEEDYLAIENGRDTSCLVLSRLAAFFSCSTDRILSFDGTFPGGESIDGPHLSVVDSTSKAGHTILSEEEANVIHMYRALGEQGRIRILSSLKLEYDQLPGEKVNPAPKEA